MPFLAPALAFAHGDEAHGHQAAWTFDPWIVSPLLLLVLLYAAGCWALRGRRRADHPSQWWRAVAFGGGCLTLAAALVSPLHALGEQLFTFHMIEHEIVMAVSAPLMVLARPIGILLWAFPRKLRLGIGQFMRLGLLRAAWDWLTRPLNATVLHGIAIWVWHAPALFDEAVTNVLVHRFQHLSFFVTAVLFWWSMLRRSDDGVAAGHLFVTMVHTSILGALIALAPRVLYGVQTAHAAAWGLTPLQDQQLAGMVMWVPAGIVYAGAALAFAARWISRSSASATQRNPARVP